jgi:hypothetical protein
MAQPPNQLDQALEDLVQALADTLSVLRILMDLRRASDRLLIPFRNQLSLSKDAIDAVMRHL